jgi:hypothetical protein
MSVSVHALGIKTVHAGVRFREHMNCSTVDIPLLSEALLGERI